MCARPRRCQADSAPGSPADDGSRARRARRSTWLGLAISLAGGGLGLGSARAGELEPSPVEDQARVLRIHRVVITGREQVSERQVLTILEREGLVAGTDLLWPEDERVERVRDRLRATGYFKRVTLRVEPRPRSDERVDLYVDVVERSTVSVADVYLGNSRLTPFRGGIALTERNFLGRGVLLGGALIWGTQPRVDRSRRQQAYKVFAEAPRLLSAPLGLLASGWFISASEPYRVAGAEDDPDPALFRTFEYDRIGGQVGVSFPVTPRLELAGDYTFERVTAFLPSAPMRVDESGRLHALELAMRDGTHRHTSVDFGLTYDGRDELFLVGKGGRFAIDVQASSPATGSQYEYIKIVAAGAYSLRLPWRHWLTPSVSGGQISGHAPLFERFYSGDLSAWTPGREQGLRYSTRNPIDVFGTGIDAREYGNLFGRVDLEYAWPLFRRTRTRGVYGGDLYLSLGVFTLVGDDAERARRREAGERVAPVGAAGDLGLRLDTALGTFSISVGNVLRRTPL
ncbi:BamA/TamA family outer membrane protein [Paraliomyxa miuraensis]|uniref:BamA/TamA family outer membrane protein n=1 Tax=Paraliomyxa miuraensis TaxID=376150 RepID=UPI0022577522|nr:BamA/TamA family outer membrane protein [Paraliomyxa miuraensis]MCX4240733.1 BamA/TamA family outer membrane protein [Paraliomyxa miuraensis]